MPLRPLRSRRCAEAAAYVIAAEAPEGENEDAAEDQAPSPQPPRDAFGHCCPNPASNKGQPAGHIAGIITSSKNLRSAARADGLISKLELVTSMPPDFLTTRPCASK